MLLNVSHSCYKTATNILFTVMGHTENDGDQTFRLPSVFLRLASLLIWLILIAVSEKLMKSLVLLLFSNDVRVSRDIVCCTDRQTCYDRVNTKRDTTDSISYFKIAQ